MGTDLIIEAKNEALHLQTADLLKEIYQRLERIEDRVTNLEKRFM